MTSSLFVRIQTWAFLAALLHLRSTFAAIPAPIIAEPSQQWEGNDGLWSTFNVRIGSPAQDVRLLISMASQETWAVMPGGCVIEDNDMSDCPSLRGGLLTLNDSTTWESTTETWNNTGYYLLSNQVGESLGIRAAGEYGFDSLSLSWQDGAGPTINHTIVAGIVSKTYYLGQLGVSPRSTNFTVENNNASALNDNKPSYLALLKNQTMIPSLSYGLQIGSYHRSQTVKNSFASLVFGGYDSSRLVPNNLTIGMGPDDGRELVVGIQSITTDGDTDLLGTASGIYASLDTTQPNLWLPDETCAIFESAFGLIWNDTVQRFLINDTQHTALLSRNPNVTFRLASTLTASSAVEITLPYGSFDLNLSHPIIESPTRYFPLMRAANSSQYTLGRTFMQEAYMIANYENWTFSIHQAAWDDTVTQHIITINAVNDTINTENETGSGKSLSSGAIAGIVVGIIGLILIVVAIVIVRRRKGFAKEAELALQASSEKGGEDYKPFGNRVEIGGQEVKRRRNEIDGVSSARHEIDGTHQTVEMGTIDNTTEMDAGNSGVAIHELQGEGIPELESPPIGTNSPTNTDSPIDTQSLGIPTIAITSPSVASPISPSVWNR